MQTLGLECCRGHYVVCAFFPQKWAKMQWNSSNGLVSIVTDSWKQLFQVLKMKSPLKWERLPWNNGRNVLILLLLPESFWWSYFNILGLIFLTVTKINKVDKCFYITSYFQEIELSDKCRISPIINLWKLTILSICQITLSYLLKEKYLR